MTRNRNLKRLARDRQARTGERYTTARAHVLAGRSGPVPVVELVDLTAEGARLGLRCELRAFPELVAQVDPAALLGGLRDVLVAGDGDRRLRLLRRAALLGEVPPPGDGTPLLGLVAARRCLEAVRAGGAWAVSDEGWLMALSCPGAGGPVLAVALLWIPPRIAGVVPARTPRLLLHTIDGAHRLAER